MDETKRSSNFTSKEETILLCLVKKYQAILENKKTDSNINKKKAECWKQLETEFNNASGQSFRDSITLRKKYDNLKKRTKKKLADEKCYALGTGGGPSKKPIEITDILAERIDGFISEFGGDAEIITIVNEPGNNSDEMCVYETTEIRDNSLDEICYGTERKNELDWSKNDVQNLRTSKSKILYLSEESKTRRNDYDSMCNKVNQWAASKANIETEKIKFIEKEHKRKMELFQHKCEVECELLRKESEAKIKKIEIESEGITEKNKLRRENLLIEKHILLQKLKKIENE